MKWISVKDKLPEGYYGGTHLLISEEVLVANSCAIDIAYYDRNEECWYIGAPAEKEWIDKITHWMPLPENPNT